MSPNRDTAAALKRREKDKRPLRSTKAGTGRAGWRNPAAAVELTVGQAEAAAGRRTGRSASRGPQATAAALGELVSHHVGSGQEHTADLGDTERQVGGEHWGEGMRLAGEHQATVVGVGGGTLPFNFMRVPLQCSVSTTYYGTKNELTEVIALAESGALRADTEFFTLDQAGEAYRRLRRGAIQGRAVITPGGRTVAVASPPRLRRI